MQLPVSGVPAASTLRPVLACSQVGVPGLDTADPQMDGMGFLPHGALNLAEETDEQTHSYPPTGEGPDKNMVGDRGRGQQEAAPWPGLRSELEETIICWVKETVGERHSRQRQQPEQRLRGPGQSKVCAQLRRKERLLQPDPRGL